MSKKYIQKYILKRATFPESLMDSGSYSERHTGSSLVT